MVDYLQEAQRNSKLINTNTRLAQTNLINKLQTLGVTDADASMNLPKLASMIGLVAGDGKMPCNLTLAADKTEVVVGESVTLTVSLTDVNGNAIPGETVSVLDENDTVLYTGIIEETLTLSYSSNFFLTKTFKGLVNSKDYITTTLLTIPWKYGTILTSSVIFAGDVHRNLSITTTLTDYSGNPLSDKMIYVYKNNNIFYKSKTGVNGVIGISSAYNYGDIFFLKFEGDNEYKEYISVTYTAPSS